MEPKEHAKRSTDEGAQAFLEQCTISNPTLLSTQGRKQPAGGVSLRTSVPSHLCHGQKVN